ncbi:MAG: glycosyltransferase family 2 protein [Gemmatimonadaceae bacterium]
MRSPADGPTVPSAARGPRPRACRDEAVRDAHIVRAVRIVGAGAMVAGAAAPRLTPGCSVVICTHRRPEAVRRFVDSLAGQWMPTQLLIVDASPDDATERMLAGHETLERLAAVTDYLRVDGPLRGLTPQRNLALEYVTAELVAFFDDDVVLLPCALGVLVSALASCGVRAEPVGGVGAVIENELAPPNALWRVRRALGIVTSLRPGSYTASGMSVPWRFMPRAPGAAAPWPAGLVEGDWLPGGAMAWRTAEARAVGFCETLEGYASGEDLEFSLRMRANGPLAVAVNARVLHLPAAGGRPDQSEMGYLGARNMFHIHQSCRDGRGGWRTAYFLYAFAMDTLVRLAALVRPGAVAARWAFVRGRLRFFRNLVTAPRRMGAVPLAVAGDAAPGRARHV